MSEVDPASGGNVPLTCSPTASRAYRKKALALHPDKGGDPELVSVVGR